MVVLKVLREFAAGTTIHGFTFLVRPNSSSWTKIIWAISLVVALTYATLEMRNSVVGKYDYIFRTMKFNQWLLMHMLKFICYPNITEGMKENILQLNSYKKHTISLCWYGSYLVLWNHNKRLPISQIKYTYICLNTYVKVHVLPK